LVSLDHGSVTLNGITTRLMNCLQSVLIAAYAELDLEQLAIVPSVQSHH